MQIYELDAQLSLFAPDSLSGKTSRARSRAVPKREMTFALSWNRRCELLNPPLQFLNLQKDAGGLLDLCWEINPPWLGEYWTRNTGESPRDVVESSLSQILEASPHTKYYLSPKACLGILRRATERGKPLPPPLEFALKIQAGLTSYCRIDSSLLPKSFHINQREETIDLSGISGALLATSNMQMQTFVTQENIAFASNQRDELRDLHDVAGAISAQPGMKQQTFVAGFNAGAGAKAGSISFQEDVAPTMKGAGSGNQMPSIFCLNDQGGKVMGCTEDHAGTLRAQEHGHQPLVFENHGIDARYTGPKNVAPTMSARYGTGGNNVPLVEQEPVYCITGNAIDRQPFNGGNGIGYQEDIAYTLTATDHHAVFSRQRVDVFEINEVVSTESARQHKDATDLIYQETTGALTSSDRKGPNRQYVSQDKCVVGPQYLIRRLTPLECERLQGYPDGWTDLSGASDSARYKALGNSVAIPCVEFIMYQIANTFGFYDPACQLHTPLDWLVC